MHWIDNVMGGIAPVSGNYYGVIILLLGIVVLITGTVFFIVSVCKSWTVSVDEFEKKFRRNATFDPADIELNSKRREIAGELGINSKNAGGEM